MDCGKIKGGVGYNCDSPLQGAVEPTVRLFNKRQILGYGTGSTRNLITSLTLESGASGYLFEGFGRSVAPSQEVLKMASGQNLTKHQVVLYIFDRGQETKNIIQDLLLGSFIAVVEGTKKDADCFEVYGLNSGLMLAPGKINEQNADNGAYVITLSTPEGQGESRLPQTFYDESAYSSTKTLLDGYLYLPTITVVSDVTIGTAGGDAETITGTNFYGSQGSDDVVSLTWVKKTTGVEVSQATYTVTSATSITFNSVALTAGVWNLKVKTSKGTFLSPIKVTVS